MKPNLKQHWQAAYHAEGPLEVSWYQTKPETSLALIAATGCPRDAGIIDVGGGASTLADHLLDAGFSKLAVLDLSGAALEFARARLGERANAVQWFEADVRTFAPPHCYGLWHDRAVFHFLTEAADRQQYVATLLRTLRPGGHVLIATFAPDGPLKCSGLEVVRYDEASIAAELGPSFVARGSRKETHTTPWQTQQQFLYFHFQLRN